MCLAGAPAGNGNRGVEALGRSVLDIVDSTAGGRLSVFDDGWGVRPDTSGRYQQAEVEYVGVRLSRRWHRPESWAQIRVAQAFGGLGNPVATRIANADALLDISGGDSFTDLYGEFRLRAVSAPKQAALRAGRPLVLLPQTYGPFSTVEGRRLAERLIRSSALAYARDTASYHRLLELAGPDADQDRLRNGVDVAFALEPRRPVDPITGRLESAELTTGQPLAGVNVNGLLRHDSARQRFGLAGDYLATMTELVRALVATGARVLFVPHVYVPGGRGESDIAAITEVQERLPQAIREQTMVVPSELDVAELKWCIGRCSWFVGSRMHATIGALSSRVPACGYAYSDKTRGVFETCGMGEHVPDARKVSGADAVDAMMASFDDREQARSELERRAPLVVEQARGQVGDIVADVTSWRESSEAVGMVGGRGPGSRG